MSFDLIRKHLIQTLVDNNELEGLSSSFSKYSFDYQRVAKSYELLKEANLFPSLIDGCKKCAKESEEKRNIGNKLFQKGQDGKALKYYTEALGLAPHGSNELLLALANRSAALLHLGLFTDCLEDVKRALNGPFPPELRYKLYERKGRSLFHLSRYEEAQLAFEGALSALPDSKLDKSKIEPLHMQLSKQLSECNQLLLTNVSSSTLDEPCLPPLSHPSNPNIESASEAICIEQSSTMGRHLVANVDIFPGDVLAVEKPYASVVLPSFFTSHCFYCQKRSYSLIPCLHCTQVFFCNEDCRESCMEESHKIECPLLPSLLSMGCDKMEMLPVRILIKATANGTQIAHLASQLPAMESIQMPFKGFSEGVYKSSEYVSVHCLEGNTDLRQVNDLFGRSIIAACLLYALDQKTDLFFNEEAEIDGVEMKYEIQKDSDFDSLNWRKQFCGGLLLRYLQSMVCNAHEVSEMNVTVKGDYSEIESVEVGGAAYPLLSLINHSCDPNVVRHSHLGDYVVLTAIQIIKKGEQIFDNYGYHHAIHGKEYRRQKLLSQYHFQCECQACTEDWPFFNDLPSENPIYLPYADVKAINEGSSELEKLMKKILVGDTQGSLPFLWNYLRLLQEGIKRPWKDFNVCQEAIKQCLSLNANHVTIRLKHSEKKEKSCL